MQNTLLTIFQSTTGGGGHASVFAHSELIVTAKRLNVLDKFPTANTSTFMLYPEVIYRFEADVIRTCRGDSGGPIACRSNSDDKWVLIGATSFGPKNCSSRALYSVYTRVSSYVYWINTKTFATGSGAERAFLIGRFFLAGMSILSALLINLILRTI